MYELCDECLKNKSPDVLISAIARTFTKPLILARSFLKVDNISNSAKEDKKGESTNIIFTHKPTRTYTRPLSKGNSEKTGIDCVEESLIITNLFRLCSEHKRSATNNSNLHLK